MVRGMFECVYFLEYDSHGLKFSYVQDIQIVLGAIGVNRDKSGSCISPYVSLPARQQLRPP